MVGRFGDIDSKESDKLITRLDLIGLLASEGLALSIHRRETDRIMQNIQTAYEHGNNRAVPPKGFMFAISSELNNFEISKQVSVGEWTDNELVQFDRQNGYPTMMMFVASEISIDDPESKTPCATYAYSADGETRCLIRQKEPGGFADRISLAPTVEFPEGLALRKDVNI